MDKFPPILKLAAVWSVRLPWRSDFIYLCGMGLCYAPSRNMSVPYNLSRCFGEERNFLHLPDLEFQFLDRPSFIQATILTVLFRLSVA
jgi:hypothetical protein